MQSLNQKLGHRERLRKKFLEKGIQGFCDYEILELLLTLSTPRKDCKPTAKEMIKEFKNLYNVFEADINDLKKIEGIGDKNVFPILLIKEVAGLFLEKKVREKEFLTDPKDVFDYLYYSMGEKDVEIFKVIYLTSNNKVIEIEDLHRGSIINSPVYPREVMKSALKNRAASLIFAHNHPSGSIKPSRSDISITRRLVHSLLYIDIKVHEHIIIGDNRYFSFSDNGYIDKFRDEFKKLEEESMEFKNSR